MPSYDTEHALRPPWMIIYTSYDDEEYFLFYRPCVQDFPLGILNLDLRTARIVHVSGTRNGCCR
jgi:hypothetical protein